MQGTLLLNSRKRQTQERTGGLSSSLLFLLFLPSFLLPLHLSTHRSLLACFYHTSSSSSSSSNNSSNKTGEPPSLPMCACVSVCSFDSFLLAVERKQRNLQEGGAAESAAFVVRPLLLPPPPPPLAWRIEPPPPTPRRRGRRKQKTFFLLAWPFATAAVAKI